MAFLEDAPDGPGPVMTGSHERPDYLFDRADLVTRVVEETHPIDAAQPVRRGTGVDPRCPKTAGRRPSDA